MRPTHHIIYNPRSAEGRHAGVIRALRAASPPEHVWLETTAPQHATTLAREAAKAGATVVVAAGGDGTIHEVVTGLMSVAAHERPALGLLPCGTGNDFAFASGIPTDLHLAYQRLQTGTARPVDIGRITLPDGRAEYWANTAGIGFDAKVVKRTKRLRWIKGQPLYVIATLLTIAFDHEVIEAEIVLDGNAIHARTLMLTLGNGPREGGGFLTTPPSRIDDGQAELLSIGPLSRWRMLGLVPRVLAGTHVNRPEVSLRSFTRLRLRAARPFLIHLDGELLSEPVHALDAELIVSALRVIR